MHTAKSNAHVLTSESLCHRLAEAGLTHARRAVEADYRRLHVPFELQHGKVLDDPLLYLIQAIVVPVKNLLGILEVEIVHRHLPPWQIEHELDVIILDAVVRRRRIIPLKLGDLLVEDCLHRCRPQLLLCAGTKL